MEAVKEAVVNAIHHRGYDGPPEPLKVYLYPDRMVVTSYPGPMPGLRLEHFKPGSVVPRVTGRNRRTADLLKMLDMAEALGTGIPKIQSAMRLNGSPPAEFDFDEESRTYFSVHLPIHPDHLEPSGDGGHSSLRERAQPTNDTEPGSEAGKAAGKAEVIVSIIETRGLVLAEEARQRIMSCSDLDRLDRWARRSISIARVEELWE